MQHQRLTKIFLARHGESLANQQKLVSGQMDTPLSPKGEQQARWLCDVLRDEPLTAIYTSSLSRSIDTAKPTAEHHGLEIQIHEGLMEMHFGLLQGRKHHQLDYDDEIYGAKALTTQVNNGEQPARFQARIDQALTDILESAYGTALIVGHRKTNEIILTRLLKVDLTKLLGRAINVKNKYAYAIELGDIPTVHTIRLGGDHHGRKYPGLKDE